MFDRILNMQVVYTVYNQYKVDTSGSKESVHFLEVTAE